MKKLCFIIFITVLASCTSIKGQYIVYDLPETVTNKIEEYFEKYRAVGDTSRFIAKLANDGSEKYVLFIINYDFAGLENYKSIEDLIKKTSRMIRVNKILLPLITEEDFLFVDFGKETMKNGRIGKKKIVFTSESYPIKFDKNGRIYD